MTDAAYIAARLGRAMPREVRLKFALYHANLNALREAGLDAGTAHKAAEVAMKAATLKSTKDIDLELQQALKRWLETQSDQQIKTAADTWDRQTRTAVEKM